MASKLVRHRQSAFVAQSGFCYYCNRPMWEDDVESFSRQHLLKPFQARQFRCTAEHLHPRGEGGSDAARNIVAACLYCNQKRHARKAALSPDAYRQFVQKRLNKGRWNGEAITQHL